MPSSLLVDYLYKLQNYGKGYDWEISMQGALQSCTYDVGVLHISLGNGIGAKPGAGSRLTTIMTSMDLNGELY